MRIIEHPKAEEFYVLGDKANIDEAQVNQLYRDCLSVYREGWEPALREALKVRVREASPEVQEQVRKQRVIPSKVMDAANLMYRLSLSGKGLSEELLDVVINAAEVALNIKKEKA